MYEYKARKNYRMTDVDIKNQIKFSNVFSKMSKTEKNKQYINLQTNLNSLSKDVRLLIDFSKDKYEKMKSKSSNKDYQYKRFLARSNFLLRRNRNKKFTSILNILNNYIESHQNKLEELAKRRNKFKNNKKLNKIKAQHVIYNRINKSVNTNSKKLPKLNLNLIDKSLESKLNKYNMSDRSSPNNLNIKNEETKNLNILTEKEKEQNLIQKKNYNELSPQKEDININDNSFIKKFPKIINSKSTKNYINRFELLKNTEKIEKIIQKKNSKIKNGINFKLAEQNLIDWVIKSKLKFARWKFGIAEIEKYFVDLNAFGKQEEQELIKRKTFYDEVEEIIDELKLSEEKKDMKKIKDKHNKEEKKDFNEFDKTEKNEENNDINMVDNTLNKYSEVSKVLQKIKLRKLNEEKTRNVINNILAKSDLGRRAINKSTDKLIHYKNKKELVIINNESKANKIEKEYFKTNSKKYNGILIKNGSEFNLDENIKV